MITLARCEPSATTLTSSSFDWMPSNNSISAAASDFATFFADFSTAPNAPQFAAIAHSESDQLTSFLMVPAPVPQSDCRMGGYLTKCCPKNERRKALPQEVTPLADLH